MRNVPFTLCLVSVLVCTGIASAADTLWSIGNKDGSYKEFAAAGNHTDYTKLFANDVTYTVGKSAPEKDWPFIQPGPSDDWAGLKQHPFRILFNAKQGTKTGFRLFVNLVDSQCGSPPTLQVKLNGHECPAVALPAGGGDGALKDPKQGHHLTRTFVFPAEWTKQAGNELVLVTTSGSWLLYDSVKLESGVPNGPQVDHISATCTPMFKTVDGVLKQAVLIRVANEGLDGEGLLGLEGGPAPQKVALAQGESTVPLLVAPFTKAEKRRALLTVGGKELNAAFDAQPEKQWKVFVAASTHTDIGYTAIQTDIEEKQVNNLLQGIADARRTASYPEGARFVWNVEVLWAADLYLQRLTPKQREEFLDAIKRGQVALNGMYLNELTGLCRPEELVRLFRFATKLGERTGVPVDSAMISDVPGYTWGTVPAMAQAGIRYFSVAPNYLDRIGDILVQWENKPFWWIGPDGQSKVLVWIPYNGYAMSHRYRTMSPRFVEEFCAALDERAYPYDIAYVRWAGHGDNAVPDPAICEFIKEWNATHAWPRFVISSTSEAFRAFEKRYGHQLPRVRGDWTPYWEDGAGSSAAETAMNRASSERLAQAETLWAMLDPKRYPAAAFEAAWNNVLLYSEHTWGAYCSISQPASPFTADQWTIKQSYATAANLQSRQLLSDAAQSRTGSQLVQSEPKTAPSEDLSCVDIFNTTSWPRSEVALIPHEISMIGDFVTDDQGRPVPAQRLSNRELAVLVRDLPPFSGRRYSIAKKGKAASVAGLKANGAVIENDKLRVRLDERTGGIVELRATGIESNLADTSNGHAINDYLYLISDNLADLQHNGPVKITVHERGPLVASLLAESDAPGCHKLAREIRLVAGADCVELLDTVDKKRLEAASYTAKEGKESVNIAFPFNVPGGDVRLDVPLGVMRPEMDQMPSACKNWLTAGRWADVANKDFGVTWVTLDAPLVQLGGITATLLNSQTDPNGWRKKIEPTQKLYTWAMNNHWHTNYRAYQEGPVQFRFVLRPHRGRAGDAENSRFATGFSQPLVAVPGRGPAPRETPLLRVEPADVLVTAFKPSDDGRAWIIRLFGGGANPAIAKLEWSKPAPVRLWLSDTSEKPLQRLTGDVPVPMWGVVTLRAELPR